MNRTNDSGPIFMLNPNYPQCLPLALTHRNGMFAISAFTYFGSIQPVCVVVLL